MSLLKDEVGLKWNPMIVIENISICGLYECMKLILKFYMITSKEIIINDLFDWFFLHEFDMLWNFFSLAYPCFSCCVWTAKTVVLRTRADDHKGVEGSGKL